jgi:hypothetical protein
MQASQRMMDEALTISVELQALVVHLLPGQSEDRGSLSCFIFSLAGEVSSFVSINGVEYNCDADAGGFPRVNCHFHGTELPFREA